MLQGKAHKRGVRSKLDPGGSVGFCLERKRWEATYKKGIEWEKSLKLSNHKIMGKLRGSLNL